MHAEGMACALYSVAMCHWRGRGTPTDLSAAKRWLERAAAQKHERAELMLGVLLHRGYAAEKPDVERAAELFQRAAEGGDPSATRNIADCYRAGVGVGADGKMARIWDGHYAKLFHGDHETALAGLQGRRSFRQRPAVGLDRGLEHLFEAKSLLKTAAWADLMGGSEGGARGAGDGTDSEDEGHLQLGTLMRGVQGRFVEQRPDQLLESDQLAAERVHEAQLKFAQWKKMKITIQASNENRGETQREL